MTGVPAARRDVVVAGGGIAGLEAVLALHDLAGERVSLTVIAPEEAFSLRPLSVAIPFGLGPAGELLWPDIMRELGGRFLATTVAEVVPERRVVRCGNGDEVPYDSLVLAPGARSAPVLPTSITLDPHRPGSVAVVGRAIELGWSRSVAFVVPGGCTWPLPLYEFALLIADQVRDRYGVALHLVTPEITPLAVFGSTASERVGTTLDEAGIIFHGGIETRLVGWHALEVGAAMPLRIDRIVALSAMKGPALPGVPADDDGFIPVGEDGSVVGLEDVWAAGDGTDNPLKQGGLACQAADAIATRIAATAGADVVPELPELVLRARLLAGATDLYLSHTVGSDRSEASTEPLWDPPVKVVSRYLAAYVESKGMSDRGRTPVPEEADS